MPENSFAFARAAILYPLAAAPTHAQLGQEWNRGAWPVAYGAERLTNEDRSRRWHEPTAILRTLMEEHRSWRSRKSIGWTDEHIQLEAIELVAVNVESDVEVACLVLHVALLAGARGAVGPAMSQLTDLVRLESTARLKLPGRLKLDDGWSLDASFLRAPLLFAVVEPTELQPAPRVDHDDPAVAWLVAGADLPTTRENRYSPDAFAPVGIAPGLRGYATPHGVSLVADSPGALRDPDLRGQCTNALLIAVLQRDALLRMSRAFAQMGVHKRWWRRPEVLVAHAEFRSIWWHTAAVETAAVDHPVVRAIGDVWREATTTDELMRQDSDAIADLHAETRARRSETVAIVSIAIAVVSIVLSAIVVGLPA